MKKKDKDLEETLTPEEEKKALEDADKLLRLVKKTFPYDKLNEDEKEILYKFQALKEDEKQEQADETVDKVIDVFDRLIELYKDEVEEAKELSEYEEEEIEKVKTGITSKTYLRTQASAVGRDRSVPSLWTAENKYLENVIRKAIPKVPSVVGLYMIELWVKAEENGELDKKEFYIITNLSEISKELGIPKHTLKVDLLYLGAFRYPVIRRIAEKHTGVSFEDIFKVEFEYNLSEDEVYKRMNDPQYKTWGTRLSKFIENTPIKEIKIKPSEFIKNEIKKNPEIGYIGKRVISDKLRPFAKDLNDFEYKLLCLIGAFKKKSNIHFNKLKKQKYLNLEADIKKQGMGTVKKKIKDIMKKFKEEGIIEDNWTFEKGRLSWISIDNVFIYPDLKDK